ncbi:MAG: MFS transporter [Planctomycetes bacterium]|nr:MFS transporter [Planctomycetota bacterium]
MNASGQSPSYTGTRLSVMMFLEFFIWGAWYVTVGNFVKAHGMSELGGWPYTVGPIAAIISPFFLGMIADRFFATQKVLGVMLLCAAVPMFLAPAAASAGPWVFIGVLQAHMLFYMPTLGLTNTLTFHNITNQEKQFPIIRVFGTIGWIVAGLIVSRVLHADFGPAQFYVTGAACVALGLFSFTLPHTPPPAKGKAASAKEILGLGALKRLSSAPFWIFLASSFLICIPLAAYYAYAPVFMGDTGKENPGAWMSVGQGFEVFFMFVMPWFFVRLGVKWMLLVGMLAWVTRYGLFAAAAPGGVFWMILIGVALHGICYDFFFVTGQIYVDKKSVPEVRGQAQGLLVLVTQGIGMLIGARVAEVLKNRLVSGSGSELLASYGRFWLIPCLAAGVVMILFLLLFRDRGVNAKGAGKGSG